MSTTSTSMIPGTQVAWHTAILWILGGIALLALAEPAPRIAIMLLFIIILLVLLNNWTVYKTYLGM